MKDYKILLQWMNIAYKKAIKKGFNRKINVDIWIKIYLDDSYAFFTIKEDKNEVIKWMINDLLALQKYCNLIDESYKLGFKESNFHNAEKIGLW